MTTESCGNCRFWLDRKDEGEWKGQFRNGFCRRRAPPICQANSPITTEVWWCGEWEQGEEKHDVD